MKKIELSNGGYTTVDDSEYGHLNKFNWYRDLNGYAVRHDKGKYSNKCFYMHRQIMGYPSLLTVDHIDGDKLNNVVSNLRLCFQKNNACNRIGWRKKKSSPYKGVFGRKEKSKINPWAAAITFNRKSYFLGHYKTAELAAVAYNRAARKYHGEFALLNKVR